MTNKCETFRVSSCVACCCTAGALAFSGPASAAPKTKEPILVELFTSQNCPACPAANEKLIDLAESSEIFPLTWSVSYWDYLGWKDSFAQPDFNKRQRKYADHFNLRGPYTPQTVVDGCVQTTGKLSKDEVRTKVEHTMVPHGAEVNFKVDLSKVELKAGSKIPTANILLVGYLPGITAVVPDKGFNKHKMLSHVNMVTSLTPVGTWQGDTEKDLEFTCRDEACVILIQEDVSGEILGFAKVPDAEPSRS